MVPTPKEMSIDWHDHGREPQCAPNPEFPNGVDADFRLDPREPACKVDLPYPAKRCGLYVIECPDCGIRAAVTTAGRRDDPKSLTIPCGRGDRRVS